LDFPWNLGPKTADAGHGEAILFRKDLILAGKLIDRAVKGYHLWAGEVKNLNSGKNT
jgi:hypothetical protein